MTKLANGWETCAIPKWIRGAHKNQFQNMIVKGRTYEYSIQTEYHGEGFPHYVHAMRRKRRD